MSIALETNEICSELIDALKHIRYIHYILLTVSFIVFIAAENRDTYFLRVSDQLNFLENILKGFNENWLHENIYNRYNFKKSISFYLYDNFGGYLLEIDQTNLLDKNGQKIDCESSRDFLIPKWIILTKDGKSLSSLSRINQQQNNISYSENYDSRKNYTLSEILYFLNELDQIEKGYIVNHFPKEGTFYTQSNNIVIAKINEPSQDHINEILSNQKYAEPALPLIKQINNTGQNLSAKLAYNYIVSPKEFSKSKYPQNFVIDVSLDPIDIELLIRDLFYEKLRFRDVKPGEIKNKFKDITTLPTYFREIPTEDLKLYLDSMIKNTDSEVNMFGINIHKANISTWGVLLITVFQLYLLMHLTSACNNYPLPISRNIPLYPSILCYPNNVIAKMCAYLTISWVPLLAVLYGSGKAFNNWEEIGITEIYFVITIIVSISLSYQLNKTVKQWYSKISHLKSLHGNETGTKIAETKEIQSL